jgi:hypothetical protein
MDDHDLLMRPSAAPQAEKLDGASRASALVPTTPQPAPHAPGDAPQATRLADGLERLPGNGNLRGTRPGERRPKTFPEVEAAVVTMRAALQRQLGADQTPWVLAVVDQVLMTWRFVLLRQRAAANQGQFFSLTSQRHLTHLWNELNKRFILLGLPGLEGTVRIAMTEPNVKRKR